MATIVLASHSCYCRNVESINQGRTADNLSFSSSMSDVTKFEIRRTSYLPKTEKVTRFRVEVRQSESSIKYGTNGRPWPIKMVPTSEIKRKQASTENAEIGKSSKGAVKGSKVVVNGAGNVKKEKTSSVLVKSPDINKFDELPPTEEMKVLPSDESFSWANENYNSVQRSIDVWSFVLSLRLRVLLDNAKWAYLGGFTEDMQVLASCLIQTFPFIKIAAPYARINDLRELLDLKQNQRSGAQLVAYIRKQADDVLLGHTPCLCLNTVQRIEEFVKRLESGNVKLRVRVLESERAAQKATILQMATMYSFKRHPPKPRGDTYQSRQPSYRKRIVYWCR